MSCTSQLATTWRTYGKLVIGGGLPGQADDTFFDGLLDEVAIFEKRSGSTITTVQPHLLARPVLVGGQSAAIVG